MGIDPHGPGVAPARGGRAANTSKAFSGLALSATTVWPAPIRAISARIARQKRHHHQPRFDKDDGSDGERPEQQILADDGPWSLVNQFIEILKAQVGAGSS